MGPAGGRLLVLCRYYMYRSVPSKCPWALGIHGGWALTWKNHLYVHVCITYNYTCEPYNHQNGGVGAFSLDAIKCGYMGRRLRHDNQYIPTIAVEPTPITSV